MAKTHYAVARKNWQCTACSKTIQKGEKYKYQTPFKMRKKCFHVSCEIERHHVSHSEFFSQLGEMIELSKDWVINLRDSYNNDNYELEDSTDELEDNVSTLLDETQDKFDNVSEAFNGSGDIVELLENRVDSLTDIDSFIEDIKNAFSDTSDYINTVDELTKELENLKSKVIESDEESDLHLEIEEAESNLNEAKEELDSHIEEELIMAIENFADELRNIE